MQELQNKQKEYDSKYWEHNEEFEKIRHITLHMGKLIGKLSTYCEAHEHNKEASVDQIRDEVTCDLLFYSLQLANHFDVKLDEAYLNRLEANIKRLHTHK